MTQKTLIIFIVEVYSKPPKKDYITYKANVYHIDDFWGLDILDIKDYCAERKRGFRYILVVIDNFSKFGWTVPLRNKNAQTIKDSSGNILINSKRSPNLIETDRRKEFLIKIFIDFLNINKINI